MSATYQAVLWNRFKKRYDQFLALGVVLVIVLFTVATLIASPKAHPVQVLIRAFGFTAIALLHFILAIGPLARLDTRLLPLLYNRRHLGVSLFLLAFVHGGLVLFWYHAMGAVNPIVSVFVSDWGSAPGAVPFQAFGFLALLILFAMAATSHDFWLANLSAPVWKTLHMGVYLAYALLVAHVAFGVLQSETNPLYLATLGAGALTLSGLHITTGLREAKRDRKESASTEADGFLDVCAVEDIPENRAISAVLAGERVAVVRHENQISAVSGVCQHQNGPLAEGKVLHGCLTCPWHGYQYDPATGASPEPFTEKIPTFETRIRNGRVYVHPQPKPAGARVEPAPIPS